MMLTADEKMRTVMIIDFEGIVYREIANVFEKWLLWPDVRAIDKRKVRMPLLSLFVKCVMTQVTHWLLADDKSLPDSVWRNSLRQQVFLVSFCTRNFLPMCHLWLSCQRFTSSKLNYRQRRTTLVNFLASYSFFSYRCFSLGTFIVLV